MFTPNKKILLVSLLLIFFLFIGNVSASNNNTDDFVMYQEESINYSIEDINPIETNEETNDLIELDSNEELYNDYVVGDVFVNPDFEEGEINSPGNVYGWTTKGISIRASNPDDYYDDNSFWIVPVINSPSSDNYIDGILSYEGNVLFAELTGGDDKHIFGQTINFDSIDSISFNYLRAVKAPFGNIEFDIQIDDEIIESVTSKEKGDHWNLITLDVSRFTGNHFFNIVIKTNRGLGTYFENFTVSYNDKVSSNFTNNVALNGDNIVVNFTNKATGLINFIFWDFGDGTNSSDINPIHTFAPGNYNVTLTVSNENNTANYSYNLNLNYITINGKMYETVQDAINDAETCAIIDIPSDLSENLIINKNVTLNFNGNKLSTGSISVVNGALVTINDVAFDGENTLSTDESSTINVYSAQATDTNVILSNGNIILDDSSFENSYLTIADANAEINYCNVNASGIIVNGGKSKIANTEFTNCDVAVSQNDGELNLTSNLFTTNKVAVNVTNGTGNINFNAIYGNSEFGLVYKGNINIDNNWFGKDDEIIYLNGNETPAEYADVYQAEETSSEVLFLVLTISSPEIMGANKEYDIVFDLTMNSNGQNTSNIGSLKSLSFDVASSNGDVEPLYLSDGIGVTTIHVGDSDSEGINYTILGKTYTTESVVVTNPEINITATVEETNANIVVTIPYATGNVSLIIDKDKYEKVLDGENTVSQTIDNLIAGTHNIVVIYHGDNVFDYTIQTDSFDVVKSTVDLINALNETIKNQTKQIDDLTSQLNETQANATKLAEDLDVANGKVDDLTSQLNETQANATKLAEQIIALNNTIAEKDGIIAGKDAEISALNETVNTQTNTIDSQSKQISSLNDTVNTQSSTIDSQKALINNLNETIKDQTTNKTSNPIATSISVKDITTTATTAKYFTISLLDANNETLVNKTIKYTVNGKTDSVTTNGSGIATVKVSYSTAGTRYYTFSFLGDDKYGASIAAAKVVVNKKSTKITAPKKTFKVKTKTKKVQIKLTSGKTVLKSKKVTLKVKGKTYTAKTNKKGIATFKITKLTKKGNFKYTVKFAGDKAYKAINKNGKIIVK